MAGLGGLDSSNVNRTTLEGQATPASVEQRPQTGTMVATAQSKSHDATTPVSSPIAEKTNHTGVDQLKTNPESLSIASHKTTPGAALSEKPAGTAHETTQVAHPAIKAATEKEGAQGSKATNTAAPAAAKPIPTMSDIQNKVTACLANRKNVDTDGVTAFANDVRTACEAERAKAGGDKKADQAFCREVAKQIVENTLTETTKILDDKTLKPKEKQEQLTKLAFMSQGLIALTNVQERFGGRLGFHCMQHSLGVANGAADFFKGTDNEFAAFCAGANHDAVMDYQPAPAITDPNNTVGQDKRKTFQTELTKMMAQSSSLNYVSPKDKGVITEFFEQKYGVLKDLKNNSEQRRNAGWKEDSTNDKIDSERASFVQMGKQLEALFQIMEVGHTSDSKDASDVLDGVKTMIAEKEPFQEAQIKGTIPIKANFHPPGFGDKLFTIGNVNIVPGPVQLAALVNSTDKKEAALGKRLEAVMDKVITSVMGNQPGVATFSQARTDMQETKDYYAKIDQEVKGRSNEIQGRIDKQVATLTSKGEKTDLEKIKKDVLAQQLNEIKEDVAKEYKTNSKPLPRYLLPSFLEGMKGFFMSEMPPFTDPVKQLAGDPTKGTKPVDQSKLMAELTKALIEDANKNGHEVVDYMLTQMSNIGTGVADLGALMLKGSEKEWACDETVALIVEENPYQASMFFEVNKKLIASGAKEGLATPGIHEKLLNIELKAGENLKMTPAEVKAQNDAIMAKTYGISLEEYGGMKEFMHLTNYFAKEQRPFADGRIQLVQHYIYEPMKAMQNVLHAIDHPDLSKSELGNFNLNLTLATLSKDKGADFNKCVGNFERMFCEPKTGELRKTALKGVERLYRDKQKSERIMQHHHGCYEKTLGRGL